MAAIPEVLRLHRARLTEPDVETIDGVRVTTPLRTLLDVMVEGNLAIEFQAQAIDEALRRGLIRRRQIEDVSVAAHIQKPQALASPPTPVEEVAITSNATSDRDVTDLGVNPAHHLCFDPWPRRSL